MMQKSFLFVGHDFSEALLNPDDPLLIGEDNRDQALRIFAKDPAWADGGTHEPCQYCLHAFSGIPYGIPRAFSAREKKYEVEGFFCSMPCAKSYLLREGNSRKMDLFHRFYKSIYGTNASKIPTARPLSELVQMIADSPNDPMAAVTQWRKFANDELQYPVKMVNNLFIRVAQVYEEKHMRVERRYKHELNLDMLHMKPKPFIMTEMGMKGQREFVKKTQTQEVEEPKGKIEYMLGIQVKKNDLSSILNSNIQSAGLLHNPVKQIDSNEKPISRKRPRQGLT